MDKDHVLLVKVLQELEAVLLEAIFKLTLSGNIDDIVIFKEDVLRCLDFLYKETVLKYSDTITGLVANAPENRIFHNLNPALRMATNDIIEMYCRRLENGDDDSAVILQITNLLIYAKGLNRGILAGDGEYSIVKMKEIVDQIDNQNLQNFVQHRHAFINDFNQKINHNRILNAFNGFLE